MPDNNYRVTVSAVGAFYVTHVVASTEEEAVAFARENTNLNWDIVFDNTTPDDDYIAEVL